MWLFDWFKKRSEDRQAPEPRLRILALSMCLEDRFLLERLGEENDWKLHFVNSPKQAFSLALENQFELILCDRNQPGYPWREVVGRLAQESPRSSVLLVSPVINNYLWDDVVQLGGYDVLPSPLRESAVIQTVDAAVFSAKS